MESIGRITGARAGLVPGAGIGGDGGMFVFYNNKLGCLGSILVSIVLTIVLILALRGCNG